jgi:DNA-binding HxlR family transcriptional regulator
MTGNRSYGDACAAARALDLVGERWALMIVRELLFGPKRFSDLQNGLPNASPTVLSQRLRGLEEGEVIQRRKLGPPARAWVYELTEWGRQLEPILVHLGQWGRRTPSPKAPATLGADALMLAVHSHLEPAELRKVKATILVHLGEDVFTIRVEDGAISIQRGEPAEWDAAVHTDLATFQELIITGRTPDELSGRLKLAGDRAVLQSLLSAHS